MADTRFQGLTDQVDFYLNLHHEKGTFSPQQREHLVELRDTLFQEYGAAALDWLNQINEIL